MSPPRNSSSASNTLGLRCCRFSGAAVLLASLFFPFVNTEYKMNTDFFKKNQVIFGCILMWLVAKSVKWIFCCLCEDGVNARGSNLRIFTLLTSGHWRGQTTQNKSGLIIFPAVRGWKLYLRPAFDPGEPSVNWSELICCAFPRKEGMKLFFHHLKQIPEKGISNQFTTASSFRFPWCSQFKVFFPPLKWSSGCDIPPPLSLLFLEKKWFPVVKNYFQPK